jgi:hypothetical protein
LFSIGWILSAWFDRMLGAGDAAFRQIFACPHPMTSVE